MDELPDQTTRQIQHTIKSNIGKIQIHDIFSISESKDATQDSQIIMITWIMGHTPVYHFDEHTESKLPLISSVLFFILKNLPLTHDKPPQSLSSH